MPISRRKKTLRYLQNNKCYFCGNELASDNRLVFIHHINHDHSDNRLKNRCLVHPMCHNTYHSEFKRKYLTH